MSTIDPDLRTILDAMPMMFFLKDTENRILLTNQAVADTLGVRPEEMEGTHTSRWYPDEAEKYHADDLEVMRSRRPKLGIIEPLRVGGAVKHWISTDKYPRFGADGEVTGILVFIRDATQQALAQAALRRSEEQLQHANEELTRVMDSISDGLWSIEFDRDGRVASQYTSSVLARLTGRPAEFFARSPEQWLEAVHPEDRDRVMRAALGALALGERQRVIEYRIRLADDSVRWLRDSAEIRERPEGGVRIDRVVTDISERRAAEEERDGFEERARHAQRLESLGILAGGIAHDFNNLLTGIFGYCDLIQPALDPASPARADLEEIREAARRAAAICNQMLAYSGRGRFTPRALDLSEVARQVVQFLRTTITARATVDLQLRDDLPAVEAEPAQVQQVVMNLLLNAAEAIEHTPGSIAIRTGVVECDRETLASTYIDDGLPAGTYVSIEIEDDGAGMSPEILERVFEPFYSTKFAGRGLGLATVLGIVRGHRGAIEIRSAPGSGTRFRVLLPASTARVAVAPPAPGARGVVRGQGLVLVVDDEPVVRKIARESLERSGFEVITAPDGPKALHVYRELGDAIGAVLLDLTMPAMDGRAVLAEMRRIRPGVSAVLSSGYDDSGDGSDPHAVEATFIRKPYDPEALVRAIDGAIRAGKASGESGKRGS